MIAYPDYYCTIILSIIQSINVFQGKTQTVPFTNIYKHILFFTWYTYDNHDNDDYLIFWVGKQNIDSSCTVAVFTMSWAPLVLQSQT